MKIRFYKTDPNAKSPSRAHDTDAGWDLYYCGPTTTVPKGQNRLLETGLKTEIPNGYFLWITNRSGMSYKQGALLGGGIIDESYNLSLKIILNNVSGLETETIENGQKIAQCILLPLPKVEWEESLIDDLNQNSVRGEKGFGSSGKF